MTGRRGRGRGSVLLVVAVLLLVLSVATLAMLRSAILQRRMAGVLQARGLALERAEAGLREGEAAAVRALVPGDIGRGCLNGVDGACSPVPPWPGDGGCAAPGLDCWVSLGAVVDEPGGAYYLQYLGERGGAPAPLARGRLFRVTARAWQPLAGDPVLVSLQSIVALDAAAPGDATMVPVARRVAWRELRVP